MKNFFKRVRDIARNVCTFVGRPVFYWIGFGTAIVGIAMVSPVVALVGLIIMFVVFGAALATGWKSWSYGPSESTSLAAA